MDRKLLDCLLAQGENQCIEFKTSQVRPEALAREIVAFSNTYGGTVIIGISDNGSIEGTDLSRNWEEWICNVVRNNVVPAVKAIISTVPVDDKLIISIEVEKGKDKPYQTIDGKYWIRVGSTDRQATKEELSRLFQASGLVHYDISPVINTDISCFDMAKISSYFQKVYEIDFFSLNDDEKENILINSDILCESEGKTVCSIGGLLMFGKKTQKHLPHSAVVFAAVKGLEITDTVIDKKEICGTLPDIIDQTAALVRMYVPEPVNVSDVKREVSEAVPLKVLRESIVNAVCHRDYSVSCRKISVFVFQDRVEIVSPGKIANTLTIEKIRIGNSAPRNMLLVKFLDNLRYFDGLGRGIPMMIRLMGNRVLFNEEGELFRVVLSFNQP